MHPTAPEYLVTIKPTPLFFALALLFPSAALLAAPVSAASRQQSATKHHVPSRTITRHRHTDPAHGKIAHHPAHTLSPHRTAPEHSDHRPLN